MRMRTGTLTRTRMTYTGPLGTRQSDGACRGGQRAREERMLGGRRRLDDANATGLDDGNATSIDAAVTWAGFISYAALSRDSVPCSLPGASYYNCRPGAEANPYSRGCSTITQCRG